MLLQHRTLHPGLYLASWALLFDIEAAGQRHKQQTDHAVSKSRRRYPRGRVPHG